MMNPKLRIGNVTMTEREREARRNQPLKVRVLDRCDHCGQMKEEVTKHSYNNFWPTWSLNMESCAECFAEAKKKAADEAYAGVC
jgi:hypothetical protein